MPAPSPLRWQPSPWPRRPASRSRPAPAARLGEILPLWSVAPFALVLLAIAVMPLVAPHFWEHNRNKAILSAVLGIPVVAWIATHDHMAVAHALHEYVASWPSSARCS